MGEPVRLRVVFEDAGLLRGSQRRRGLQRCWLQLRPGIVTIAELAAHILATFGLQSSCPHGLIISLDGFVLPSFESTCILKDEDIITIKKNGVMFQDIVKFCGNQNQEQVLQSRQIFAFNNKNLAIMDRQVESQGDKNDTVLFNRSTLHIETPPSETMNEHMRKRSNKLHGSNNTLAIKDSQGNSTRDEENVCLHGNIANKETTSNEMVNSKCKKKHSNKLQTSDALENKDSQADSQGDKGDLGLPIPHKETSSSEMIKPNRKRKHYDKLQGSDDTLTIKDSQRNSQREEEGDGLHGNIALKEATSNGMMNANPLTTKKFLGNFQGDEGDFSLSNGKTTRKETSCEMKNAKRKGKHSNKLEGSNDIKDSQGDSQGDEGNVGPHGNKVSLGTASNEMMNANSKKKLTNKHNTTDSILAVRDSHGDSPGDEKKVGLPNGNMAPIETPSEITNEIKRKHSNKHQPSKNESKENDDGHVSKNDANGDARKVPSRSARRKKAKRLWYRNLKKEKEVEQEATLRQLRKTINLRATLMPSLDQEGFPHEVELKKLIEAEIPKCDNQKKAPQYANADHNIDVDEEIVPVIVRPGHIRFESSDGCKAWADEPVETLRWNGTTSKKKGQKWGRENTFNKWDDDTSYWLSNGESSNVKEVELVEVSNGKSAVEVEAFKECIVNQAESIKECSGNPVAKEFEAVKQLIEFESFLPLIRLPEEGDVLVYRVVELSSSWCPELSSFRVGRVSSYDCSSSKVVLLPLPEYPFILEEMSAEGQESRSLYKEDGTLEVDFASLVDVRLFKARESIEVTPRSTPIEEMQNAAPVKTQEMLNATPVNNRESASCSNKKIEISSNHTVNDQLSEGWEAIEQALNEKKSQLQKQNDLDKRNSTLRTTTTGPWSYRALRRNALGPTLAMLRSNGYTSK